jgi:putative Ca2+/H+ antiporter (TMEM165/GDT1 family)
MMLYLLLATYGAVLLAELVGDKSIYTISSLTSRLRPLPVFVGISLALSGKTLAAVTAGRFIAELPASVVTGVSAATFFTTGAVIWFKKSENRSTRNEQPQARWSRAVAISFAAVFFTEWADIGQITTATLAAHYHAPLVVWLGATLALMTKGALAITIGLGLQKLVPIRVLRALAVTVCAIMGVISIFSLLFRR